MVGRDRLEEKTYALREVKREERMRGRGESDRLEGS